MLYLGLRIGELQHMKATWIKADGSFGIPEQQPCECVACLKHKKHPGYWGPKTKAGVRIMPLPGLLNSDLLKFLGMKPDGLGLSRTTIWKRTKTLMKLSGIKIKGLARDTAYPHVLRATCATMLAEGGMDAAGLTYYMGWNSIQIGDTYIRLARAKDSAAKQARQIFG